jgi:flagellar protein FliO/FliZ
MIKVCSCLLCVILLCLSAKGLNNANAAASSIAKLLPAGGQTSASEPVSHQSPSRSTNQLSTQTTTKNTTVKAGELTNVAAPDVGSSLIQVTFGLFVVLMIIAAAAWFSRRFGHFQATAGGSLRIIGGLHLGAKERLVVVQVGEEQLLLGVAPGRVATLHVLAKPLNVTGEGAFKDGQGGMARQAPANFRDYLTAVLKRGSK